VRHPNLLTPTSITELIDNADANHFPAVRFLKWRRYHPNAYRLCQKARKDRITTVDFLIWMSNVDFTFLYVHENTASEAQPSLANVYGLFSDVRQM
jgi:hypothetical protein